ncbi:MAG: hypothetical protein M3N52_10390, partial [Actinomycetota bacterium]|nr:hypothetical protein [Actinomycetota bacterium]
MASRAYPLVAAVLLALLHLLANRMTFLDVIPRSRWLSLAGGISVAYVFVHLLPELAEAQETVVATSGALPFAERHAYLLALAALVVFYGVERLSQRSASDTAQDGDRGTAAPVAWLSIGSYAAYNALIGYVLTQREEGLATFAFAMAVHFVVNDHGLRLHHRRIYHRYGRWLCAGAILVGWAVGVTTTIPEGVLGMVLAFLAG